MSSSSQMDERTAREIYLSAFEGAIKQAKPWTVMCSYNRINGVYAAENKKYLTDVLRKEWGFDGFVVSDWGAVNDRVPDLKAGLELEMPSSFGINDAKIVEAVKRGELEEEVLDRAVERILTIVNRFEEGKDKSAVLDRDRDHELAREAAADCMVLLKNDSILPLEDKESVAFIGAFAEKPRYQGGGSSHINSYKVESALEMAKEKSVIYAKGYEINKNETQPNLLQEAVDIAKKVKTVVIFAGLPDTFESESFDRQHMKLPDCQNELIEKTAKVNKRVIVVLYNGSPVEMPWIHKVGAVLEAYLGGQAVGGATVQVLYGQINPSGRLAETFPVKLQDNPSYLYYLGERDTVEYREGVFVGYRYYDKKEMEVLFPFGHGLSYTTFEYSDLQLDKKKMKDTDTLAVSVKIKNSGTCAGKEVVQLYVSPKNSKVIRPVRELKEFQKIYLTSGEEKTVTFKLSKRAFAYFDINCNDWYAEDGEYEIQINRSSREIILCDTITIVNTAKKRYIVTPDTTIGDILELEKGKELLKPLLEKNPFGQEEKGSTKLGEGTDKMMDAMFRYMPLRSLISFSGGSLSDNEIEKIIQQLNK